MSKTISISEMQKFSFNSKITFSDGEDGILTHLIFDPATRCMTHIGVKQGRFFGKTVHLPYATVVNATGDGITLNVSRSDASTDPTGAVLDNKTVVENTDSSGAGKGTLMLVAVHPEDGELAYLVVHHLQAGQDTLLRQEFITELASGHIRAHISASSLNALPPYRSDSALQQEVEAILYDITPLHVDLPGMTVRVLDSVLAAWRYRTRPDIRCCWLVRN
ncbi:MAG: hypothetical protein NVS4B12_27110 [Ktedonobacteraceae bacterium]